MKPMTPIAGSDRPWPPELGEASTSGAQNGIRYAFFPRTRRLLIERDGAVKIYDTGNHLISGVAQQSGERHSVSFTSQDGTVDLGELQQVS